MERCDDDVPALPSEVVSVLIAAIGRLIVLESALGISTGHDATLELVNQFLERYEVDSSSAASS